MVLLVVPHVRIRQEGHHCCLLALRGPVENGLLTNYLLHGCCASLAVTAASHAAASHAATAAAPGAGAETDTDTAGCHPTPLRSMLPPSHPSRCHCCCCHCCCCCRSAHVRGWWSWPGSGGWTPKPCLLPWLPPTTQVSTLGIHALVAGCRPPHLRRFLLPWCQLGCRLPWRASGGIGASGQSI